jgi:hypothetical protein
MFNCRKLRRLATSQQATIEGLKRELAVAETTAEMMALRADTAEANVIQLIETLATRAQPEPQSNTMQNWAANVDLGEPDEPAEDVIPAQSVFDRINEIWGDGWQPPADEEGDTHQEQVEAE